MLYATIWIIFGLLTAGIANSRGENAAGWFIGGALFGPLAVLYAYFRAGLACPHCRSRVPYDASVCPKCQRDLPADTSPDPIMTRRNWILVGVIAGIVAFMAFVY